MPSQRIFSLSIRGYVISFLVLVASLFLAFGLYTWHQLNQAQLEIEASNQQEAKLELQQAIQIMLNQVDSVGLELSQWDEIKQQLDNPAYYAYWRQHRLLNNNLIPDYIDAAELYDASGERLAETPDSLFPHQLDVNNFQPTISRRHERLSVDFYFPIYRHQETPDIISGYLALHFGFLTTLHQQAPFNFLYLNSIDLPLEEGQKPSLSEAIPNIQYQIIRHELDQSVLDIVHTTIINLASIIALLCLLFYWLFTYLFSQPISRIARHLDRLREENAGVLNADLQPFLQVREIEKVRVSLNNYRTSLAEAQSSLDLKNRELWEQAHHDSLTGMLNRRAFEIELDRARSLLQQKRIGLSMLLFDLNLFKAINDSYGHQVGDEVLIKVSQAIAYALRKSEMLYRLGGDEFAAILIGADPQTAMKVADRCLDQVNGINFEGLGIQEKVRVSCGVAHCQAEQLECLNRLSWQADVAVYKAKRPGITKPVLYQAGMSDGSESVFSSWINNAVYDAVVHGHGLEMHYQPIVCHPELQVSYYEALVRIRHENDLVPPANIFPIITSRHLETELDQSVIRKIHEDLEHNVIQRGCGVSLNLSAQSVAHEQLIGWLKPLVPYLKHYTIVVEVTETDLITQLNTAVGNLQQLRDFGFKIALDDFGSGYSSLRYLTNMPVDTIKFDISLIQGMSDEKLRKLVSDLAHLLLDLDYELVAEGIEDSTMLELASQAGFKGFQGYFLSKPQVPGQHPLAARLEPSD